MSRRRDIEVRPVTATDLQWAKRSFVTRRVPEDAFQTLITGAVRPRSGDLVLARVSRLGNHKRIESPDGRKIGLHVGDTIVVAYADRYATDQYESFVPNHLGATNLVASGGIASDVQTKSVMVRNATDIVPIGLLGDVRGRPLNVADFALPRLERPAASPRTICVLGTSMNAGKTTTIHHLVHGLSRRGMRPGVTKVTGTGSGNDFWQMWDAGAHQMIDFTDAGLASSFRHPLWRLEDAMTQLCYHLTASGTGVNLVEIADGVFMPETGALLESETFAELVDVVLLAASDAMGAAMGVQYLAERGVRVAAVSGALTKSDLAAREARAATGLPVWNLADLGTPEVVAPVLGIDPELIAVKEPEAPPAWDIELHGYDEPVPATASDQLLGEM